MSHRSTISRHAAALVLVAGALLTTGTAHALIFVVNDTGMLPDDAPGDGVCATATVEDPPEGATPPCTLAAALDEANAFDGHDHVVFDDALAPNLGAYVNLVPLAPLVVSERVTLDGTTAPGYSGGGRFPAPTVQLDGTGFQGLAHGIHILPGGAGSIVRGFAVFGFTQDGIAVEADDVWIEGCFVGLRDGGTAVAGNLGDGITVVGSTRDVVIGPKFGFQLGFVGRGNVISGNLERGIVVSGEDQRVVGNRIGTTPDGEATELGQLSTANRAAGAYVSGFGPRFGAIEFTSDGTYHTAGNLVSGNGGNGLAVDAIGGTVEGNRIGTNATGTAALRNRLAGIAGGDSNGVVFRQNVVSGNGGHGIELGDAFPGNRCRVEDNRIGVAAESADPIPNEGSGIFVSLGSFLNRITGNVIGANAGDGIRVMGNENTIAGNWIGTDSDGTDLANGESGIEILGSSVGDFARSNRVGGTDPGDGNVIGHNGREGIRIAGFAELTSVEGNWIGTDALGRNLPNGAEGIRGGQGSQIGGPLPGAGNVIGFNSGDGIHLVGDANRIQGNWIGTDALGRNLGNGGDGIEFAGNLFTLASARKNVVGADTTVDDDLLSYGNVIAHNGERGVHLGRDNFSPPFGGVRENAIRANAIYGNGGLGIDLFPIGPNANDPLDLDEGSNLQQNFPAMDPGGLSVDFAQREITVVYAVDTQPGAATYPLVVDFYLAEDGQEGRYYLGTDVIPESEAGELRAFELEVDPEYPMAGSVVATATDSGFVGSTSEFSPGLPLGDPDRDADGVVDPEDNCREIPNGPALPDAGGRVQWDADGDGFGNVCDADFNQDGFVGGPDFDSFLQCFGRSVAAGTGPPDDPTCAEADMNGDDFVGGPDFDRFLAGFGGSPGP